MRPYLFVFKLRPQPNSQQNRHIEGALATVFVFANTAGSAQDKSISYLNNHGWFVEAIEYIHAPTLPQIVDLGETLRSIYRKAELNGIAAQFDTWQKDDRPKVHPP